jgi:hypothetical protein
MTDVAAMLSYVSALMEFEAGGVPVHMLINIALALIVTFRVLKASFKGTASAARYVFSRKAEMLPGEVQGPEYPAPETPSFREALEALACSRPTYDDKHGHLMCQGLLVSFGHGEDPVVVGLTGCPVPNPNAQNTFLGIDLARLMSPEEKALVCDHAKELRREVIRRDNEEAGQKAALAMRHQRLKHRLSEMREQGAELSEVRLYDEPTPPAGNTPPTFLPISNANRGPVPTINPAAHRQAVNKSSGGKR